MSTIELRPFSRADRDQVTDLVNAHIAAVIPGCSVSVNAVMSQLEREPGEYVVDPWVRDRATLVAVERERVVGAAHLLRYADEERVGGSYRDAGEIRWLAVWPGNAAAGETLVRACLERLERWGTARQLSDPSLPAPAVYGVPANWPHIRALLAGAGFTAGPTEVILVADVADLPAPGPAPLEGVRLARDLGSLSTRLVARRSSEELGYAEVSADLTQGGTRSRLAGWAELDNLHVAGGLGDGRLATWLLAHAGAWLRLARAERLLAYARPEEEAELGLLAAAGFTELTRTERGWMRHR